MFTPGSCCTYRDKGIWRQSDGAIQVIEEMSNSPMRGCWDS